MMKKTVGIITFHAAHNYGSNLQAFALQKAISNLGCECEIINFRTERQKDQYTPLTKRRGFKYVLKNAYFLLNYKNRKRKYDYFEEFIENYLKKSKQDYSSMEELMQDTPGYEYYVSGSDQIWNTVPNDADDSYFLPFVKNGKRIAYAPSFGQRGTIQHKEVIAQYLSRYEVLSVREKFAQGLVDSLIGKIPPIMPDPTLLLDKSEWEEMIPQSLIEGEYLFFYTLFATKEMIDVVKQLSERLKLPVVISNVSNQFEVFSGFKKVLGAGPLQFMSLIKNAKFICTTSFHGTVFSVLLQKPFFVIDGMSDNRISTLLDMLNLTERSIILSDFEEKLNNAYQIDFQKVEKKIGELRKCGLDFLRTALEMEE